MSFSRMRNLHFLPHLYFISCLPYDSSRILFPRLLSSQEMTRPNDVTSSIADDVNAICRVLNDYREAHHDIESALGAFSKTVSADVVEQVLKRCSNLGFPAHRFFLWARKLPGFNHSRKSYHVLVSILGRSKQFPLIWDFLLEMREGDVEIRPEIFWIIFRIYCRAKLPVDAARAFKKMEDFGLKPDINDFHQLLSNLCRNNLMNQAQEVFDNLKNEFQFNLKTYSIIIKGWGDAGNFIETHKLFDEMLGRCVPDVVAYNTLLRSLCQAGKIDKAYKIFEGLRSRDVEPNASTYSVFIRAFCDANDAHSTVRVLERMARYKLVPNVFTYNCVIKLFCKNEMVDEAYEILDEMLKRGAKPDIWSYNTVMAVHCRCHEVNKALRLLSQMDRDSCLPDRHTYNMLLKMLIDVGRIDRAVEVWNGMGDRGFYPSVTSYAVMVHGLCKKKGRIEEACRYFEMMVDEGIPPYVDTCQLLRDNLLNLGLRDRVQILMAKMQQSTSCSIQELSNAMGSRKGHSRDPLSYSNQDNEQLHESHNVIH